MTTEPTRASAPDEQWERLARYLAGESSPAETAQVRQWLAEDPRRSALLDALQRATAQLGAPAAHDIDVEAALQRVSARIAETPVRALAPRRDRRLSVLARAAAVVILLGAGVIVWRLGIRSTPEPIGIAEYSAPVGALDSVQLADGTRVLLAPGSRLAVAAGYGRTTHQVELAGEALFDVAPAAAGRFTVHAGQAFIRDLGTTFSVRSDPAEVRVVVTVGSVVLRAATVSDSGTILRAGDRAVLSRAGQVSAERGTASGADLAWTSGRLVFDNATLVQVGDELRRWYGIRLQFADSSLAARHFTASFAGEDAQRVLDVLALALDVDIERSGNTATLRRR